MSKKIKVIGVVVKNLPSSTFLIRLKNNKKVICYISGKMRINFIRIIPGDEVLVEFGINDFNKGRIVYRIR